MSSTTATRTIRKVVRPGTIEGYDGPLHVFAKIDYNGDRLSITGVEGPKRNGDAGGSAGQIAMGYAHRDPSHNDARYSEPTRISTFADGWTEDLWFDFLDVWKRWHLNDMRAECEHQRELGWTYGTHTGQDCPTCGYRIGSEWRREDVPADVLDFLESLPEADRSPAWV